MSGPRRRRPSKRANPSQPQAPRDLWRAVTLPDAPDAIAPSPQASALIASLGQPPLRAHGAAAEQYLTAVVERAAMLATALAASADLLVEKPAD
jgi:hypothetical protein